MAMGFVSWNLWHGCHKKSEGCKHCYVFRGDEKRGVDANVVYKTKMFDLPIQKLKNGEYKVKSGNEVATCFSSDFFLEDADEWRIQAWEMIKERQDLTFLFITKRIDRFYVKLPSDWGSGYDNVTICCTCENQKQADYRLPLFLNCPIKHRAICCEPLLEEINLLPYLDKRIDEVVAGGESGIEARICDYNWILSLLNQCKQKNVTFHFKQTGAHFLKNDVLYNVPRFEQHKQARKANINYFGNVKSHLD